MSLATQTELRFPNHWGGRRASAGRKKSDDSGQPHLPRAPLASRHPCHVTVRVRENVPSLRTARLVREVERSFSKACDRSDFRLIHYTLMGNHVHLIVEAANADALGRGMKSIGSRLARAVNRVFSRKGPVFKDRFHHRVLKSPREVRHALSYVLLNARKHARRLPTPVRIDPASSGRWFHGWKRSVRASHTPGPRDVCPVAPAHTWLLKVGWKRRGKIDPAEVPG